MSQASSNWLNLKKKLPKPVASENHHPKRKRSGSISSSSNTEKKTRMSNYDNDAHDTQDIQTTHTTLAKPTPSILPTQVSGIKAEIGKYLAMDCEMVGVGRDGEESVLARVSIVNYHGAVIYDTFVRPVEKVTDFRTWVSGVTFKDVEKAPTFSHVQKHVSDLLHNRILVGHAIANDLKALLLTHPPLSIRDTAKYEQLHSIAKTKRPKLKALAKLVLGIDIQENEHSSVIDAQATMEVYKRYQSLWEATLARQAKIFQAKKGGKKGSSGKKSNNGGKKKNTVDVNSSSTPTPASADDWWNQSAMTTA
ncbi:hypothetical protein E3P81_03611 [Wallemia ichthyophaga]|nr:hypothetical protein E3P97_02350 [Wallemia ichthyophaga]TIB28847.1 hypothetical protein E3P85_03450 [Wallemia ichthyophaga]TIB44236.1 hypothetical protein E3P82_03616 [Wallemia ichthyophaga]TIB46603.1 hypothetical protein E3P81_03611 [Wallemia ichthyophaga]TIB49257.1 hypothetical protein E3P80_03620 [Wallemia ichthyophaga]